MSGHAAAVGRRGHDRGSVDVSIEMLFGMLAVLAVLLLLFEAGAYWHARNVFDDAASDGARVAAAYDGSCAAGVEVARASIERHAGSWASGVDVTCLDGPTVVITIRGRTPGVLAGALGFTAQVSEATPRER
jgi:hypothetical protein